MAVDLNDMATNIETILKSVPGIVSTFDYEPQNLQLLPAATLYFDSFAQTELTTRRAQVGWKWTIRLYIDLNTSDLEGTQKSLRDLISNTLKQLRNNISLNSSCLFHTVANGDVYVMLNKDRPQMAAELELVATTEESM